MIRGTTPVHTIKIPISTSLINRLVITYKQGKNTVLEKRETDVEYDSKSISWKLSQQETLGFEDGVVANIQIRIKTVSGDVWNNKNPIRIQIYDSFNTEVL